MRVFRSFIQPVLRYLIFTIVLLFPVISYTQSASNEAVGRALKTIFESGKIESGSDLVDSRFDQVKTLYANRSFKPIWTRDNGPKGKAKALVSELEKSAVHGLKPEFYKLSQINKLMAAKDPSLLAKLDLLLSGALVEFGGDLINGRIGPQTEGSMNAVAPLVFRVDEYIKNAEASGNLRNYMSELLRSDKRYVRLIAKLVEFIRIEESGQWPVIDANGKIISVGSKDSRISAIRKLLVITGDLPISAMKRGNIYDQTSIEAVKIYQQRHGLEQTGDIDRQTLAAMAQPLNWRIQQIKINLERRRWQVRSVAGDHIYINLADGSIRLVLNKKTAGRYDLQNNRQFNSVPVFLGNIEVSTKDLGDFSKNTIGVNSKFVSSLTAGPAPDEKLSLVVDDIAGIKRILLEYQQNTDNGQSTENSTGTLGLPIFVTYLTAWATRDGRMHFRSDIFNRDKALAGLLGLNN